MSVRGRIIPLSDEDWYDETDYIESNDWIEASEAPCPRCKGTGMDRWEQDECSECLGEGTILNALPIVPRIG